MPTVVTAQDGDTLCTLAINNGLHDCLPLRAMPENAAFLTRALVAGDSVTIPDLVVSDTAGGTDTLHPFEIRTRQVRIRFVHGSPNLPYAQDLDVNVLNISNFNTERAGANEQAHLASGTHATFDAHSDVDPDAFKVEVVDTRPPGARLDVVIEPLRPTYDASGNLSGHVNFDGDPHDASTDRGYRSLLGHAYRIADKRFRTPYLRLVVDDYDLGARAQQTVLVTDMVASGDPQVEILDQDIRATYVVHDCPASPATARCRVEAVAQIGRGQFVDVAITVLRATPSGVVETNPGGPGDNGVVRLADIRDRINTFCRRYWAQDMVKFKIVGLRTVDLPSNMLTIGDETGSRATGTAISGQPGKAGFTMRVQRFGGGADSVHVVLPININANDTPEATAGRLRDAINAVPGFAAEVSVNPPEVGMALGSADVLIRENSGGRVTVTNLTSLAEQDSNQEVGIGAVSLNFLKRNDSTNYHVGHPQERNLYKMLETGSDRLDIFVIQSFDGEPNLWGFTVTAQSDLNANQQPLDSIKNTVAVRVDSADGSQHGPYLLPHEIGHALLDCALHALDNPANTSFQLMRPFTLDSWVDVNDPKRLIAHDPPANNWFNWVGQPDGTIAEQRIRMNTLTRVRTKSAGLLHS